MQPILIASHSIATATPATCSPEFLTSIPIPLFYHYPHFALLVTGAKEFESVSFYPIHLFCLINRIIAKSNPFIILVRPLHPRFNCSIS